MSDLFDRVVLPVASDDDAAATARALDGHEFGSVLALHVVEKAGGAPDKAGVEQREEAAEEAFAVLEAHFGDDIDIETEIRYDTDVADAVFAAAADFDASAIVITPRGGSRWVQLLTGDVALSLVTEADRPVVVLPDTERADGDEGGSESE
ncbi:universal stress protein [Halosimplex pelagicum]|uniref:Universal stress protein n=1 Tax=Halosimplex pelagicum TaxID=869886 RepID=A0A7D5TAX6_9EURY|nr:universal stress protein [Halosimplex pelagicum]QLH83190.1 universal stress protein [Halosimplex pelagicum]